MGFERLWLGWRRTVSTFGASWQMQRQHCRAQAEAQKALLL